ncbi:MAG: response regulator transcription factor, partial [Dehalococcoidia bacterium]|nr:response regulator transcription factor [Dehalococcoidia bacterium]
MINLLIIDENAFLRLGLRTAIGMEEGIEVVGDTRPGDAALEAVAKLRPDVVLMSLRWPDMESIALCHQVAERFPNTRVVMLSDREREEEIVLSVLSGASGYVSKYAPGSELALAITLVSVGGTYFRSELKERVTAKLQGIFGEEELDSVPDILSRREVVMLRMVGEGYGNEEIGEKLGLAPTTVRNGVSRIRSKLGLNSRYKLI